MKTAVFHVPYTKPGRNHRAAFEFGVQNAIVSDEAGVRDFFVGEHATQAWEQVPNPEILIGAAALQTKNIRFAPMAHLLPLHLPGSLAIQTGWLSQILEGRYFLGVGTGAYVRDAVLRGLPADMSEGRPRMIEALEVMRKVWKREPFQHEGRFYKAAILDEGHAGGGIGEGGGEYDETLGEDIHALADFTPWDGPQGPELAVTGLSPRSSSMRWAGEIGAKPVSFFGGSQVLRSHWDVWKEGAEEHGHPVDESFMTVCRDIFVADTDEEARRRVKAGPIGETWSRYLLAIYVGNGIFQGYADDIKSDVTGRDVDLDWIIDNVMLVGSPETVAHKIENMIELTGIEFGCIAMLAHDATDDPEPWFESTRRFAQEVAPLVKTRTPIS